MAGIYAEAWSDRLAWLMSYAKPLSWMALVLLKSLIMRTLALLLGFVLASPVLFLTFWIQDLTGWGL